MTLVDWTSYAQCYDFMCRHNPAYGDLLAMFESIVRTWSLTAGDRAFDLGGGTGNFSVRLAKAHPDCEVCQIDSDSEMNAVAAAKAQADGLRNWSAQNTDLSAWHVPIGSAAAVVAVHVLYVTNDPIGLIRRVSQALCPDGFGFFCDIGRVINCRDWTRYLFQSLKSQHGVVEACRIMWHGRHVAAVNRQIARSQRAGRFWRHSLDEFVRELASCGLDIVDSGTCYRGYSDFAVCRKRAVG